MTKQYQTISKRVIELEAEIAALKLENKSAKPHVLWMIDTAETLIRGAKLVGEGGLVVEPTPTESITPEWAVHLISELSDKNTDAEFRKAVQEIIATVR